MSRMCQLCGKSYQVANLVPRGIGNRVTKRTSTHKKANLRSKKFDVDGRSVKVTLCSSCLKRIKKDVRDFEAVSAEKTSV